MKKENESACSARLGKVGGGALIEGVMMRAGNDVAVTCRREDGRLCLIREQHMPLREKCKFFGLPFVRGAVNFVESMILSMKTLNQSAEIFGEEEEESRAEKWMKAHLGFGLMGIITAVATVLGVLLSLALFLYLPRLVSGWIETLAGGLPEWASGVIEGGVKVVIFVAYISLVSLMPDIRRTFMYHGAEHKSIACYEAGAELTPAEAKKYSRFHPRCGTSFMFVMILLGIAIGIALRYLLPDWVIGNSLLYTVIRVLLLPLVMAFGFEFIRFAGKHPNAFTRALSAPGMWMQRLTTLEPDEAMLEVAITSLKAALREDFPDFDTTEYEANTAAALAANAARAEGKTPSDEEKPAAAAEQAVDAATTANETPADAFVGDPADAVAPEDDL